MRSWVSVCLVAATAMLVLAPTAAAGAISIPPTGDLAAPAVLFEGSHIDLPVTLVGDRAADVALDIAAVTVLDIVVERESTAPVIVAAGSGSVTVTIRMVARRPVAPLLAGSSTGFASGAIRQQVSPTIVASSSDTAWNGISTTTEFSVLRAPVDAAAGWWTAHLQQEAATHEVTCSDFTVSDEGVPSRSLREGESLDCWVYLQYPVDDTPITMKVVALPADRVTISQPIATFTKDDWRRVHRFTVTGRANGRPDTRRETVALGIEVTTGRLWGPRGDTGRTVKEGWEQRVSERTPISFWAGRTDVDSSEWAYRDDKRLIGYLSVEDSDFEPLFEVYPKRIRVREGGKPAIVWVRLTQKPPRGGKVRLRLDGTDAGNGMLETFRDVTLDLKRWNWWYPVQVIPKDGVRPTRALRAHPWLDMGDQGGRWSHIWGLFDHATAFGGNEQDSMYHPMPTLAVDVSDTDKPRRASKGYAMTQGCLFGKEPARRVAWMGCTLDQSDSVGKPPLDRRWPGHVCAPRGTHRGPQGTYKLYGTHQTMQALVRGKWVTLRRSTPVFAGPDPASGRPPAQCGIHYQLGWEKWKVPYPAAATMLRYINYGFRHEVPYKRYVRLDLQAHVRPPNRPPWRVQRRSTAVGPSRAPSVSDTHGRDVPDVRGRSRVR